MKSSVIIRYSLKLQNNTALAGAVFVAPSIAL